MVRLKIIYLFFILYLPVITQSQSDTTHLIKDAALKKINEYHKIGNKAEEAKYWEELSNRLSEKDTSATGKIKSLEKALALYKELNNKEKQAGLMYDIAVLYVRQGRNDEAEAELLSLLDLQKSINEKKLYKTYDLLTIVSKSKGNLNKALFYAMEAFKNVEIQGDTNVISRVYFRLGKVYEDLGQIEKCIPLYKKALEILKKGDPSGEEYKINIYNNVANIVNILFLQGQQTEALDLTIKTIQEYPPVTEEEKGFAARSLADCYNMLAQYERTEKYYLEAIAWEERKPHGFAYRFNLYYDVGKFYSEQQKYNKAKYYLKEALKTKGRFNLNQYKDIYFLLFKSDSAAGNYLSAIQHFQMHKMLNDSIFNETKSKQIEELQIQYETEQREKDIQLLQNKSQLQQGKLLQAVMTTNITFGGIAFLLVIIGLLYSRFRMKQRVNRQLEIQQIEINQTNRSLQHLLEEKEWLLREIHHRVKNNLQIVMSLLNTQSIYLESDAALNAIRDSQHRIRSISLIHQKLYQSHNVALIDMPTYIQELVDYLQDSFDTHYHIHFDLNVEPIELDVTQAVPLGLILNEAISNAIKYAFPTPKGCIKISLQHQDETHFSLTISDNGVGLPDDFNLDKSNTLGINLMKGLSKQLNGNFNLINKNGLTIHITFTNESLGKPFTRATEMQLIA